MRYGHCAARSRREQRRLRALLKESGWDLEGAGVRIGHVGWLGLGVANLVNVFNPGLVIFGGTLRDIYLGAAAQIRSVMAAGALAAPREKVKLRTAALGDDTTLVGAAEFAFAEVLSDPVQVLTRLRTPEDSRV